MKTRPAIALLFLLLLAGLCGCAGRHATVPSRGASCNEVLKKLQRTFDDVSPFSGDVNGLYGHYSYSDDFNRHDLYLSPHHKYYEFDRGCVGGSPVEKGQWVYREGMITLHPNENERDNSGPESSKYVPFAFLDKNKSSLRLIGERDYNSRKLELSFKADRSWLDLLTLRREDASPTQGWKAFEALYNGRSSAR